MRRPVRLDRAPARRLPELSDPTAEHRLFRSTWLRLAVMIGQSGRPVLWLGVCTATLSPPVTLLDTTGASVDATSQDVCSWLAQLTW